MDRDRTVIVLQTIATIAGYVATVVVVHRLLPVSIGGEALRLALSLVVAQSAIVLSMLVTLLARRGVAERRALRSRVNAARAHAAVAEHASGADRLRLLRGLRRKARRDVDAAVSSYLSATRGTMRDRVLALAHDLGADSGTLAAATGDWLAASSLYDRAISADALLANASAIATGEMPRIFAKGDERECIAALDLVLAWRRSFHVEGFRHVLGHPAPTVRSRAFDALPFLEPEGERDLLRGLNDPSDAVRAAAAGAAGRTRHQALLPALIRGVHDRNRDVATASAFALARMPAGAQALQELIVAEDRIVAATALEAVEKATLGRL